MKGTQMQTQLNHRIAIYIPSTMNGNQPPATVSPADAFASRCRPALSSSSVPSEAKDLTTNRSCFDISTFALHLTGNSACQPTSHRVSVVGLPTSLLEIISSQLESIVIRGGFTTASRTLASYKTSSYAALLLLSGMFSSVPNSFSKAVRRFSIIFSMLFTTLAYVGEGPTNPPHMSHVKTISPSPPPQTIPAFARGPDAAQNDFAFASFALVASDWRYPFALSTSPRLSPGMGEVAGEVP